MRKLLILFFFPVLAFAQTVVVNGPQAVRGDQSVSGVIKASNGTSGAPSITFSSAPTTGFYLNLNRPVFSYNGNNRVMLGYGVSVEPNSYFGWSNNNTFGTIDLALYRDAANALALRNGTNSQKFYVYSTHTNNENYERFAFGYNIEGFSTFDLSPQFAGTGANRALGIGGNLLYFRSGTPLTARFYLNAAGHFLPSVDNIYDIGSSDKRVRTGYFSTSVVTPYVQTTLATPATSGDTCTAGKMWTSANYIYVCSATNTIKRAALSTF